MAKYINETVQESQIKIEDHSYSYRRLFSDVVQYGSMKEKGYVDYTPEVNFYSYKA